MLSLTRTASLCLVLFASARVAFAQDSVGDVAQEADLHFQLGVEAFSAGRYRVALEYLLRSNRLVPNRNVAFNIALTLDELGRYADAYRYYADFAAIEPDPARRAAAEQAMARLGGRVALVEVISDPPGAEVYVDRKNLGSRGVAPLVLALPAGPHEIIVARDGYDDASQEVSLEVGRTAAASLSLDRQVGTLRVTGGPAAMEVRLGTDDGVLLGTAPGDLQVPVGQQLLVFSAPGHAPQTTVVGVDDDAVSDLVVQLAVRSGRVTFDAAERGAEVRVDGAIVGYTPTSVDVPVGPHEVVITRSGFSAYRSTLEVVEGQSQVVNARLSSLQELSAASKTREALADAPASASVISGQEIRAFGYEDIYDALAGTRGAFQSNDLAYRFVGFRGFLRPGEYGNRVLMTLDGHTTNEDQIGAPFFTEEFLVDLLDVEQIEVVRGSGSALYGTNAFFGVINVVSRRDEALSGPTASVAALPQSKAKVHVSTSAGDADLGGWVSVKGMVAEGDDYVFEDFAGTGEDLNVRDADGSAGFTALARGWARGVEVQAYYSTRVKRLPNGAYGTVPGAPGSHQDDHRAFVEARAAAAAGPAVDLTGRLWLDHYRFYGDYQYQGAYVYSDRWVGTWVGAEPRLMVRAGEVLDLTVGAEGRASVRESLESFDSLGETYLDVAPSQVVGSAYAEAEVHGGEWVDVVAGGRVDYFSLQAIGATFNPRGAVILHPSDRDTVKLISGTAFRAPSVYEFLYEDGGISQVPAGSLDPETVVSAEAEYTRRVSDVTTLTVGAFTNRLNGLIDAELTGDVGAEGDDVFRYANVDERVVVAGGEAEVRRDWRNGWMFLAQAGYQRVRVGGLDTEQELTNSPAFTSGIKAAAPLVPGFATLANRLVLESGRVTNDGDRTEPMALWDATLTGSVPNTLVSWAFGVRNVLDWSYSNPVGFDLDVADVPMPGRDLYLRLTVGAQPLSE